MVSDIMSLMGWDVTHWRTTVESFMGVVDGVNLLLPRRCRVISFNEMLTINEVCNIL